MSRPATNKSLPPQDQSIRINDVRDNRSVDKSEIMKSRVSHRTPKKTNANDRAKNYSNAQKNKLHQSTEPLDRQKVIEQNMKLKSQISEVLTHVDEILEKDKLRREEMLKHIRQKEQDQEILELQDISRIQQREFIDNKATIKNLQRQLENTFEINKLVEKENELRAKELELKQLIQEEESINKINRNQRDALNFLNNKQEYEVQLGQVKKMLQEEKRQNRELAEELLQAEKQLQKIRESNIAKEKKTQELDKRIKDAKKNPVKPVTNELLEELEEEVQKLEAERNEEEKQQREILKRLEQEKQEKKIELEKKSLKFTSMEKEIRLNKIIINESAKLVKIHQVEQSDKNSEYDRKSNHSQKPSFPQKVTSRGSDGERLVRNNSRDALRKQAQAPQKEQVSQASSGKPPKVENKVKPKEPTIEHKPTESPQPKVQQQSPPKQVADPIIKPQTQSEAAIQPTKPALNRPNLKLSPPPKSIATTDQTSTETRQLSIVTADNKSAVKPTQSPRNDKDLEEQIEENYDDDFEEPIEGSRLNSSKAPSQKEVYTKPNFMLKKK